MKTIALLSAVVCGVSVATVAEAAFLVPDGATAPFEDWTRGDANSTYAEWDSFTNANAPDTNNPDVGESGLTGASLVQNGAFAIIASSGNIYSFAGATEFDVTLPGYGLGAGNHTRVVVQTQTLGSEPDLGSVQLTYSDGVATQTVAAEYVVQEDVASGEFTGLVSTFGWDLVGVNPSSLLFELGASASSMSLAGLTADTFTQAGAFAAFPATVPEPTAAVLACVALLLGRGMTRRV